MTALKEKIESLSDNGVGQPTLTHAIGYYPPLDWDALLAFIGRRAAAGVEWVDGDRYLRTVRLGEHRGWMRVEHDVNLELLRVEMCASLAPVQTQMLAFAARLFDLSARPGVISTHLGEMALRHPGLRVPGAFDGFEVAVRAILGQQVSVAAATVMAGRFAAIFGERILTPFGRLSLLAPTAERVADALPDELAELRIVKARASSIVALAKAVAGGTLALDPTDNLERTMSLLRELPGVGEWTTQYIAMRALSWPDAFPHTDLGIRKALGEANPKRILAPAERWRPWRAYAAMHLWDSLEASNK